MRFNFYLAAAAATLVSVSPAFAQAVPPVATDTDTAYARGVVLGAHSLVKKEDLDFGVVTVDPTSAGGTVSIAASAAGTRSVTGGVSVLSSTYKAAKFDGSAAPNESVVLIMSGPATTSLIDGAGNNIPSSLSFDAAGTPRNADGTGGFTVYVGGTFTIANNQAPGVYGNDFDVTANYQ
jgi:hypothetical protein